MSRNNQESTRFTKNNQVLNTINQVYKKTTRFTKNIRGVNRKSTRFTEQQPGKTNQVYRKSTGKKNQPGFPKIHQVQGKSTRFTSNQPGLKPQGGLREKTTIKNKLGDGKKHSF